MDETTPRKGPKGPDDAEWICPFSSLDKTSQILRRRDLVELGDVFKSAMTPLSEILEHMRDLNARWSMSNKQFKQVIRFQVGISALSLGSLLVLLLALSYAWAALEGIEMQAAKMQALERSVSGVVKQLSDVKKTTEDTEERVVQVQQDQDSKPQLELVPELDPVKTQRSPVKLRVMPPAAHAPSAKQDVGPAEAASAGVAPLAEIPLSPEAF